MRPVDIALREYGVREIPGSRHSERVLEYLEHTPLLPASMQSQDETPWCSAFINWCMAMAGMPGTGRANARSWIYWGRPCQTPTFGCLAVLWRKSRVGIYGHVGFVITLRGGALFLLGGNQGDMVSIKPYPLRRLLQYKWMPNA